MHTLKLLHSLSMCLTTKWSMVNSVGRGPERLLFERSSNLRSCTKLREDGTVPVSSLLLKSTSCIMGISEWCWQQLTAVGSSRCQDRDDV